MASRNSASRTAEFLKVLYHVSSPLTEREAWTPGCFSDGNVSAAEVWQDVHEKP